MGCERKGVRGGGEYLTIHSCHHQNDPFCVKVGSEESCFNASLIVGGGKSQSGQCPQTLSLEEKEVLKRGFEPTSFARQPNALLLGQAV